ncbi:efflux transporter [Mycena alexandri]|uniref:Efflux transporter n=1 Tax=Mycena alexandri TaxID=1745969 RepID=A0AAD6SRF7_9AGAR|nr:efflux transporter [Mycena alexandri]
MDIHPSPPSPPRRSNWRGVAIAATCTAAMLVNSSNNTSVAIALPTIGADLHARAAALQWLVSAYSLSSGCLLLFCGHLADVHGRKRVFVIGSIILFAFTLACGFVHDEVTLAVLRGFQGVGGAATIPAALGILAHEFPPSSGRARAAAFASFSAGGPIGAALGMILGGLLTQLSKYTWRAQFYLSAGIAFATLVLGIFAMEASPPQVLPARPRDTRTDWPGAILSAAGLILLVFVLGQGAGPGPHHHWYGPHIISILLLSILLLALFATWEGILTRIGNTQFGRAIRDNCYMKSAANYTPPPLLPPSIFTRAGGRVGVVYGIALLQFAAFMIWAFWVQLYYQVYIGYSPVRTVVRLTPMFVTGIICNVVVALIVRRVPTQLILASGTLTTSIAPLLFALIRPSAPYWAFGFPAAVCSVVGVDFLFAAGMLLVSDAVDPGEQSVAGGVFQTMTQLGTSFGVTASTILFNHIQGRAGFFQKDALASYQAVMWMGAGFGGLGSCLLFSMSSFGPSSSLLLITATLIAIVALRGVGTIGKQGPRDGAPEKPADTNAAP